MVKHYMQSNEIGFRNYFNFLNMFDKSCLQMYTYNLQNHLLCIRLSNILCVEVHVLLRILMYLIKIKKKNINVKNY